MIYKAGLNFFTPDGTLYATLDKDKNSGDLIEASDFNFTDAIPKAGEEIPEFMHKQMGLR